jgi:hypothetical protein
MRTKSNLEGRTSPQKEVMTLNHPIVDPNELKALLRPESPLEQSLIEDELFIKGLLWGRPRYGHPEGQIALHVREVMDNIEQLSISDEMRNRLRIIALAHDTFKFKEVRTFPRDWSKHHGMLAKNYLANYIDDPVILDILELHDEAFYCWRMIHLYHKPIKGQQRLEKLLYRLGEHMQLYYLFFKCDTQTGDKTQAPLYWFETSIPGIQVV